MHTERTRILAYGINTPLGKQTVYTFIDRVWPVMVVGTALVQGDILHHMLVEDSARRQGFATEILAWLVARHGPLGACWVSESGQAFARAYEAKHGHQPWRVGGYSDEELGAFTAEVRAGVGGLR